MREELKEVERAGPVFWVGVGIMVLAVYAGYEAVGALLRYWLN